MYTRHLKILGLSLLALVGVMAVSASAAQAKWLLLLNKVSVLDLKLKGPILLSELLVNGLGLEIHCTSGTAEVLLQLLNEHKVLSGNGTARFTGCKVLKAEKTCTVKSPGAAAGEIVAKGEGTGAMTGEEVYALLTSSAFTTIAIEGALCPLNETEEVVSGSAKLTVHKPLEDSAIHLVLIEGENLKFGEETATLHGELLEPGVHDKWVLAHLEDEAAGATWAIHLVNL